MYILEHPTRGILVDEPDCDRPAGIWSWAQPRTAARRFNFKNACYVRGLLPPKVRRKVSILECGTWLIALEAEGG